MSVVAGIHAQERGEVFEGFRAGLGDSITAVGICCGWKRHKTMLSDGNVDDTHAPN